MRKSGYYHAWNGENDDRIILQLVRLDLELEHPHVPNWNIYKERRRSHVQSFPLSMGNPEPVNAYKLMLYRIHLQVPNPFFHLISYQTHNLNRLACRVRHRPLLIERSREEGTRLFTTH